VGLREEIPWPNARPAPANRLPGRAEIFPVTGQAVAAWAAGAAEQALRTAAQGLTSAIELVGPISATGREALTVSEAEMFRAAAAETGMPSEEVPGDTAGLARVAAAAAACPVWGLAAAEAVFAEAEEDGVGRRSR